MKKKLKVNYFIKEIFFTIKNLELQMSLNCIVLKKNEYRLVIKGKEKNKILIRSSLPKYLINLKRNNFLLIMRYISKSVNLFKEIKMFGQKKNICNFNGNNLLCINNEYIYFIKYNNLLLKNSNLCKNIGDYNLTYMIFKQFFVIKSFLLLINKFLLSSFKN